MANYAATFKEKLAIHTLLDSVITVDASGEEPHATYKAGWTDKRVAAEIRKTHPKVTLGNVNYLRAREFGKTRHAASRQATSNEMIARLERLEAWVNNMDENFKL
jgi:hypothetical protein